MEFPHRLAFLIGNPLWKLYFPMDFPHGKNAVKYTLKISIFHPHENSTWIYVFHWKFPIKSSFPHGNSMGNSLRQNQFYNLLTTIHYHHPLHPPTPAFPHPELASHIPLDHQSPIHPVCPVNS